MLAKYDLTTIFNLVKNNRVLFIATSRSKDCVSARFPNLDEAEVENYILNGIIKLKASDFASSSIQWGLVCDIYGKNIDGINWYIKFAIEKDEIDGQDSLSEISFHPLEDDLKLNSQAILKKET